MKRINSLFIFVLFLPIAAVAQMDSLFLLDKNSQPFTLESYYQVISKNHPIAQQIDLLSDLAQQEIRMARGNFDPTLEFNYQKKDFNDTEYYTIVNGGLKLPTYFPVDPKIGIERNSGQYLNPERYISNEFDYQQFYAGLSLPIGKGLFTDERRATLQKALLFSDFTEAEQVTQINKLLLDATKDYWQWFNSYYQYRLMTQGIGIATEIFNRTKVNFSMGEAAAIDTVQAKIILQQRLIERQEAFLGLSNYTIHISTYLWDSLGNPVILNPTNAPILDANQFVLNNNDLLELVEWAKVNHPELRKLSVRIEQGEIDRRLAVEFLKPELNLSYTWLNQPFDPEWNSSFSIGENYKFGLDFSFPILLRKERGRLSQAKLKLSTLRLERNFTERQIINEINQLYNEITNTATIIEQQSDMTNNYALLLQAELINLENGESDLFKINIQQEKYLESQKKLVKLLSEYEKQKATLYWAAGKNNLTRD